MAAKWFAAALAMAAGPSVSILRAQAPPAVSPGLRFPLAPPVIPALDWQPKLLQSPSSLQQPAVAPPPATDPTFPEEAIKNAAAPCIEPPPLVRIEDYNGPFQKVVGTLARPLERKSVHPPHFKPGTKLCTLTLKGKFLLFVNDSLDPVTFLEAGFQAGLDHGEDSDYSYGQGAEGYGRRYGAEYAGEATSRFFGDFLYPAIFSEDPRYYRLAHGSVGKRFLHAMGHAVVAHNDNGHLMFNFAEWLGTSSSVVLANTYHPDNQRGFTPAAESVISNILQDAGFDVLREFWPEISRKFKLPFRGQNDPTSVDASSPGKPAQPSSR
jgi:hypothetical protein